MSSKARRAAEAAEHNVLIEKHGTADRRAIHRMMAREVEQQRRIDAQCERERIAAERQRRIDAGELDPSTVSEQHVSRAQGRSALRIGNASLASLIAVAALSASIPPARKR